MLTYVAVVCFQGCVDNSPAVKNGEDLVLVQTRAPQTQLFTRPCEHCPVQGLGEAVSLLVCAPYLPQKDAAVADEAPNFVEAHTNVLTPCVTRRVPFQSCRAHIVEMKRGGCQANYAYLHKDLAEPHDLTSRIAHGHELRLCAGESDGMLFA